MLACVRAGKLEQEEGEARQGVMWACEGTGWATSGKAEAGFGGHAFLSGVCEGQEEGGERVCCVCVGCEA